MSPTLVALLLVGALLAAALLARRADGARGRRPAADTARHCRRLYSRRGFLRLGGALVAAGALAFSGADEAVDRWHERRVRSPRSDRAAAALKPYGERFWFLAWALFALADAWRGSNALTRWGRRNWEAMLAGLPLLWTLQYGLGASRPTDAGNTRGADWRGPLRDDHSASGHAFIAAIPWLTAARMAGGRLPRAGAYAGSLLTGWSRLNDRKHYLSQVGLGWFAAWAAVAAVADVAAEAETRPAPAQAGAGDGAGGMAA